MQHMGTGQVGVLGKFGKGGSSLQNMQGSKSGAISVELVLTNDNFFFTFLMTFADGGIEMDCIFATLSIFLTGGILMDGRIVTE